MVLAGGIAHPGRDVGPGWTERDTVGTRTFGIALRRVLRQEAPTGLEPVEDLFRSLEPKVRLYAEHFREAGGATTPNV